MESDGRRRLRTLHCMKCGAPLVTRTTPVKPEHIPLHLKDSPHNVLTRQVCSKEECDWVVSPGQLRGREERGRGMAGEWLPDPSAISRSRRLALSLFCRLLVL